MRIGIIYYSNQGNTKATADLLAKQIGAKTVEMTENIIGHQRAGKSQGV